MPDELRRLDNKQIGDHRHLITVRAEARQLVYDYIERFYTPERMHSTFGCYKPIQYEKYGNVT